VRELLAEYEAMANGLGRASGALMEDLESVRRWYLSLLADIGAGDLDAVIPLLEGLRNEPRLVRNRRNLGARFATLRDTVVLVLEPGLRGMYRSPPVFLVISSKHDAGRVNWRLVAATEQTADGLSALSRAATDEQAKLLTGELSIRSNPSDTLTLAAAHAWDVLPDEVRTALLQATTVWYLPTSPGTTARFPMRRSAAKCCFTAARCRASPVMAAVISRAAWAPACATPVEFHNTGLYNLAGRLSYPADNAGLYDVTHDSKDVGKFKAPTLRNIAVTAPSMHDGSVATLEEALDHYAAGGRTIASGPFQGIGRDNPNKTDTIRGFALSASQRADLIAFLQSLTDEELLRDPRFADPWTNVRKH
jgi:hypothetical protein